VTTISSDAILNEPWPSTCALLVIPGGADLGYCNVLNGAGNSRITRYIQSGGSYLGLCAGGYYGSSRCEFEVGNKILEVIGDRELRLFPGICRGGAFRGFVYHSEEGARAATVELAGNHPGFSSNKFKLYCNGGGVFVDADKFSDRNVQVVARYTDELSVKGGNAAVVYIKIGQGQAILTGPHPE
jgi:biotin--protein ligase